MRNKAIHILLFLLFLSLMGYVTALNTQAAEAATGTEARITDINIMDNAVEVSISGEFTYTAYKPSDPFTVAVDLPDVDRGDFAGKLSSDKAGISEVMVSSIKAPNPAARLEILLVSPSEVEATRTDGTLLIKVKDGMDASANPVLMAQAEMSGQEATPPMRMPAQGSMRPASSITDVAFDYSDGTLKLVIKGDGAMAADVYSLDGRIVVDVPNVSMRAELPAAVVAPVKSIRQGMHNGAVRLVIDLKRAIEFDANTVENSVVISMPTDEVLEILTPEETPAPSEAAKAVEAAAEGEEGPVYTGKIISLDFQNADIVPIFRFIGDISGYNVVVHPSVSGTVTLKLMNVPWDQALDIILNIYSLEKQIDGNIMTIAPTSVFDKIAKEKAARRKTDEVTAELVRRTIHLDYIDVADMETEVEDRKALSPRGTMTIDSTGNDLWVEDTAENLQKVYELVEHFDRPLYGKQQIMVEARIVIVESPYTREMGIQWGASEFGVSLFGTPVTGNFEVNNPLQLGDTGEYVARATIPGQFTGIAPYATLNLTLSALETMNESKTISNPRVLTLNGEPASIQSGTQIPVTTTTAEGSTTEFVNANLSLDVTPNIKPNGIVELEVSVNKDEPVAVGGSTGINTRSVITKARVKDGETLVLGGIYENSKDNEQSGLPGLRKIPLIGWLFGSEQVSDRTDELLILITPRVIKDK